MTGRIALYAKGSNRSRDERGLSIPAPFEPNAGSRGKEKA